MRRIAYKNIRHELSGILGSRQKKIKKGKQPLDDYSSRKIQQNVFKKSVILIIINGLIIALYRPVL